MLHEISVVTYLVTMLCEIYNLRLSVRLNSIKYSQAGSCVRWLNGVQTDVS
jgi:hypothetical protein